MAKEIIELTNENFEKELIKNGYAIIDFWAPWCGPCRMMSPVFDEIAQEIKNVKFCKCNVDESQDIATNYRVSSIPNFIIFKDGKAIASKTGGCLKEELVEWIKNNIK